MMWKKQSEKILVKNHLLSAELHKVELPGGKIIDDYLYIKPRDGAIVVAITENQEFILLEHYKYAIGKTILTLPGGLADSAKETLSETARRELLEETGYEPKEFKSLGFFYPMPGNINQKTEIFLALDCRAAEKRGFMDETEFIKVSLVARDKIKDLILGGEIADGMSLAALCLFENQK